MTGRGSNDLGSHVRLRAVTEDDLPVFFEHQQDPEAARMAAFPPRERDAFETHWARILGDASVIARTVVLDGQAIGNVVCFERDGRRLVGYWIGREHWGRGVATSALAAFLEEVTARPLHARVAESNLGSRRVLEKCGFELQGREEGDVVELVMRLEA